MATVDLGVQERAAQIPVDRRKVNDFSIQVATVNGSGSQSANTVLLRSIFQMGVPVSGKNLFPSNIAGLPRGTSSAPSPRHARNEDNSFLVAHVARRRRMVYHVGRPAMLDGNRFLPETERPSGKYCAAARYGRLRPGAVHRGYLDAEVIYFATVHRDLCRPLLYA